MLSSPSADPIITLYMGFMLVCFLGITVADAEKDTHPRWRYMAWILTILFGLFAFLFADAVG